MLKKVNSVYCKSCSGIFLSEAGPKSGCFSYLIAIMRKQLSNVCRMSLIFVIYHKKPLLCLPLDKINLALHDTMLVTIAKLSMSSHEQNHESFTKLMSSCWRLLKP